MMIHKSNLKDKPIIELEDVTLQIPLMSKSDFSLKRKIIKSVTGGGFTRRKDNSFVTALNSVNLKVHKGEKIALMTQWFW
jgi:ABC-type polysaccharide/polyol phosphate transport system ATPase subunit